MLIYRIKNRHEYEQHQHNQKEALQSRHLELRKLEEHSKNRDFSITGFSITAEKNVKFLVDWAYSDGKHINWRERLICPVSQLNNRQRASYHLFLLELQPYPNDNTYITEQVTPFYQFLDTKINNLIGSEFIDASFDSGYINEEGIRHEDMTKLSFESESLDKIISFDCLEHIPNYQAAIQESYRSLKPGGRMLCSFPFDRNQDKTLVRAIVADDGTIEHLTEPEYHGDPFTQKGCLSYYTFGWDILDTFRSAGFKDVYALVYWSDIFGYLGHEQIMFVANK